MTRMKYQIYARVRTFDGGTEPLEEFAYSYDDAVNIVERMTASGWWKNDNVFVPPGAFDSSIVIEGDPGRVMTPRQIQDFQVRGRDYEGRFERE